MVQPEGREEEYTVASFICPEGKLSFYLLDDLFPSLSGIDFPRSKMLGIKIFKILANF